MKSKAGDIADRFSLVVGGPFHAVLARLGLIGADELPAPSAALGLALLAWMFPGLLAIAQSLVNAGYSGWGYFTDWTVVTRYFVSIWLMIATERYADGRLIVLTQQFRKAQILSKESLPAFDAMLDIADRRSSSVLAESVILVAALVWSGLASVYVVELTGSSWEGTKTASEIGLSWAGEATRFVSNPLFLFLTFRWIWRFLVWAALLFRISRLPLQLTPMHPDRSAGLGFMVLYPGIFSGFAFALSCVIASSLLKEIGLEQHNSEMIWFAMAGWLVVNLLLFLGPLFVFAGPLYALRERALLEYGCLAHQHHLAFQRKWIGETKRGEDLMSSSDPSSASDLNASVQAVQQMRILPVDSFTVVQLVFSAGLPMLAVVTTLLPISELAKWIVGEIL